MLFSNSFFQTVFGGLLKLLTSVATASVQSQILTKTTETTATGQIHSLAGVAVNTVQELTRMGWKNNSISLDTFRQIVDFFFYLKK